MAPVSVFVGLSRIYTGNHFPLDVLGGLRVGDPVRPWGVAYGLSRAVRRWRPASDGAVAAPTAMPHLRKLFLWLLGPVDGVQLRLCPRNGPLGLAGDERSIGTGSRRALQAGYYSKPPMIAYVDHVFVGAGGNKEWSLRSGAILFSAGALVLAYALTLRVTKKEGAALIAAVGGAWRCRRCGWDRWS